MIVYLHGFNSSPQSFKARLMQQEMARQGLGDKFICPALPHRPHDAVATAVAAITPHLPGPVTLVGSSMGGFYATFIAETLNLKAVLVNPAVRPHKLFRDALGPQKNLYTGERYELTQDHLNEWEALDHDRVTPSRYLVLLTSDDEVLDYRDAQKRYRGAEQAVIKGGDHSFAMFGEWTPRVLAFAGLGAGPV
jgi:hypothetical protein